MIGILIMFAVMFCLLLIVLMYTAEQSRFIKVTTNVTGIIMALSLIGSISIVYYYYTNSVLYKQEDDGVATRGFILKEKVILSQYKLIGEREYIIFKMNEYSRSDREFESILVISK